MIRHTLSLGILCAAVLLCVPAAAWPQPNGTQEESRPESPDRPPRAKTSREQIVLIHGLGADATIWDGVKPYLAGTADVWVYELHGHGKTQPIPDPTIAKEAAALREFLTDNNVAYPTLVGHGMGGLIAMRYAFDHPADIHRLIVIDAAPRQLATTEEKVNIANALVTDYDRFVASRYSRYTPDESLVHRIVDLALRTHQATFVSLLMSSFDFDMTEELPHQTVPILVVGSEMLFPAGADVQVMLDHLGYDRARNVAFKRIEGSGHYVMLERTVYTAHVLLSYAVGPRKR
jgi:pimeloyl-ACP methyl ester carboxylesterase